MITIGVDIESVTRFRNIPLNENKEFYERVFTQKEIAYCTSKASPAQHFASRFCAKEACVKALLQHDPTWKLDLKHIEVRNDKHGRPSIKVVENTDIELAISMSHSLDTAIATVLATRGKK
ncbi:TPA: holo-[acyl-carrier-protein] synthase [Candidatus Woesearchaeota archaeon]|nr:holo-[acyl-carrier-protein] synthase [archaeon]HIJ11392.1 holo-[acyl-carrier-protein] synthase [Candidatus Woesearchaeota archaeon]|tara:strand:- start:562 stop:924 length:363 start_codon:yes stop_codon:yes gene_type:complete